MVSFQTQNPNLGKFWRATELENVDIFYGHLDYFTDIWDILMTILVHFCSAGTFCRVWCHVPRKIWQPWFEVKRAGFFSVSSVFS
jgi:hypothetical protein